MPPRSPGSATEPIAPNVSRNNVPVTTPGTVPATPRPANNNVVPRAPQNKAKWWYRQRNLVSFRDGSLTREGRCCRDGTNSLGKNVFDRRRHLYSEGTAASRVNVSFPTVCPPPFRSAITWSPLAVMMIRLQVG